MEETTPGPPAVFTVGHSTRTLEEFIDLLQMHGVEEVVDIRTIPRSRHNPQFNKETLPKSLEAAGIGYRHAPGLGGLRHPRVASPNTGWHNASFRGFADYMQTAEFEENLEKLIGLLRRKKAALMCAEAVPWRCHRSLIADALLIRHITVNHIMGPKHREPHKLTPWARIDGLSLTYPESA